MLIISFAWTTPQLLAGKKTVTRRAWDDYYAKRFLNAYRGQKEIQAYDKSPRNGGKCVALIRIISMERRWLSAMSDQDEVHEGGLWGSADAFIKANQDHLGPKPWRIEFEVRHISPTPPGEK